MANLAIPSENDFSGIVFNLTSMAICDLVGLQPAVYHLADPGPLLGVAGVTVALLGFLGGRLMLEERDVGG